MFVIRWIRPKNDILDMFELEELPLKEENLSVRNSVHVPCAGPDRLILCLRTPSSCRHSSNDFSPAGEAMLPKASGRSVPNPNGQSPSFTELCIVTRWVSVVRGTLRAPCPPRPSTSRAGASRRTAGPRPGSSPRWRGNGCPSRRSWSCRRRKAPFRMRT